MAEFTGVTMCLTVPMYSCQCPPGWKGTLCTETVSVCDPEHRPPPLCAHGSTCIPLPNGYTCQCPLGTAGLHCETGCNTEPINPYLVVFFIKPPAKVFIALVLFHIKLQPEMEIYI